MGLHTTDAIVLRRYLYRETSVIVTCLTDRYGKIKGLVKGLRAQPSRHRSAMEPLTINSIVFYDTRTSQIHLISQCELTAPLSSLTRNIETMQLAGFCVDLTDTVVPLDEPQPQIYQLLRQVLEHLDGGTRKTQELQVHFIVRLLKLVGFQPQLDECAGCGTQVATNGFWSVRQGGILCENCLHEDPKAEPASPDMLESLAQLAQSAQPPILEANLASCLLQQLESFLRWRLDRPLKTLTT